MNHLFPLIISWPNVVLECLPFKLHYVDLHPLWSPFSSSISMSITPADSECRVTQSVYVRDHHRSTGAPLCTHLARLSKRSKTGCLLYNYATLAVPQHWIAIPFHFPSCLWFTVSCSGLQGKVCSAIIFVYQRKETASGSS